MVRNRLASLLRADNDAAVDARGIDVVERRRRDALLVGGSGQGSQRALAGLGEEPVRAADAVAAAALPALSARAEHLHGEVLAVLVGVALCLSTEGQVVIDGGEAE